MRFYQKINGKLSPEDVDDIVRGVVASNRLEGVAMQPEEIEMLRKYMAGEISRDDYMTWALACVGVNFKTRAGL